MEFKFDILKHNLYVVGDEIYFGIDSSDVISVSKSIDNVVNTHIGELKVREGDIEVAKYGKSKKIEERYTIPLKKYLDALERNDQYKSDIIKGITNKAAELFGLSYILDAQTIENREDMDTWKALQIDLAKPDNFFEKYNKESLVCRLDKEKTLKQMKKLHEKLDPRIPGNYAQLVIVHGEILSGEQKIKQQILGILSFIQLKAKDKEKIKEAKGKLIERLKEIDGPCLSFDAPVIYRQMMDLYLDAPKLVIKYGNVLKSPLGQTGFFRLYGSP